MAEWLPQITPDTSYQEMLERPSAFNPRPELIDGDFLITHRGVKTGRNDNTRHGIQYSDGTMLDVEWPIQQAVRQDRAVTRPLQAKNGPKSPWQRPVEAHLGRFDYFWEPQAAMLAHKQLSNDGRPIYDRIFDFAFRKGLFKDPNGFTKFAAKSFEYSLQHGMPSTAYAIAKTAFRGVVTVRGEMWQCAGLRPWLDEQVTHALEPGISHALGSVHVGPMRSNEAMQLDRIRRNMATQAINLAQSSWVMRSLQKADIYYENSHPALTEKIVWHQIMTGKQAIVTAQELTATMNAVPNTVRATTSLKPEGQTAEQLGSYVLDILH